MGHRGRGQMGGGEGAAAVLVAGDDAVGQLLLLPLVGKLRPVVDPQVKFEGTLCQQITCVRWVTQESHRV
jgi:hypothetical protein